MEIVVPIAQLDSFAATFWKEVKDAVVFAVHGEMGAGKTTTIAALCRAKGVQDAVSSPTFSIINEYAYAEHGHLKKLFHIDLYRLRGAEEVVQAGVEDCVYSGAICFVEWPEKAPHLFDENTMHVVLTPVNATVRNIKVLPAAAFPNSNVAEQS
jgi:tRNA threonylcarbamoyladenosine biosynthesis protein TsaE